jgi:hypothetical protein
MTTQSSSVNTTILKSFSDWEKWFGKLRSRCPDDVWSKINPEQPDQRLLSVPIKPQYSDYHHDGATNAQDLNMIERGHYDTAFKEYQFQWHLYEKEQTVVKDVKQYIRDTVADDKQVALDETKSVSNWIQSLYATSRPTSEQLVRIATAKYRESLAYPTKDVLAWFTKWDEAMALSEKYQLFGGHKGMWIKDIHNIWLERFPIVVEQLYSDYDAGNTPDLTYRDVSRRFRNKIEIESELKRNRPQGSMRGSAFLTTYLGEPTFQGESAYEEEPASKPSKRRRDATTTDFGSNKKRKKSVDSRPCAACGSPYHSLKQCWLVIGAPEGRQVSEERKKAFAKKKRLDSDFAKLVKEVLKLKEEMVDD